MRETPIGVVIKEIAAEKNLKTSQLAGLSGKSRQGIYVTFGRSEMTNTEIEEWAKVLGVTPKYIFDRWKKVTEDVPAESAYLLEHLTALEEQFKRLLNQLDVKDRQIEKLMDLLGKPDLSEDVTCPVHELISYKMSA